MWSLGLRHASLTTVAVVFVAACVSGGGIVLAELEVVVLLLFSAAAFVAVVDPVAIVADGAVAFVIFVVVENISIVTAVSSLLAVSLSSLL